jgi:hypothetical protein
MLRWLLFWIPAVFIIEVAGAVGYRTWPRKLNVPLLVCRSPICTYTGRRLVLRSPSGAVAAEVGTFKDELQAYLRFEYLVSRPTIRDHAVLLTSDWNCTGPLYRLRILLPNDILTAVPYVEKLRALGLIPAFRLEFPTRPQVAYAEQQTRFFQTTYDNPVRDKLKDLSPSEIKEPLARFLVFKSETDRRVRQGIKPVPTPLSIQEARQLAGAIISVAGFYGLPIDVLVGVGAMENNFMDMNGDLQHALWRRRAAKGDIVVKRWRRRVLVCDSSVGVWQLTRKTLQYAHSLYLQDRTKRDYLSLPPRLRPAPELSEYVGDNREVLTTYAALLLRHLVDHFGGDLGKAVGAYNGGPRHPNADYASDVEMVADYARKIMEHAVAFNDETAHPSVWLARPPQTPMLETQTVREPDAFPRPLDFPPALSFSVGPVPDARIIPGLQASKRPR